MTIDAVWQCLCPKHFDSLNSMRMITGALLILAAEQAFAHALLVPFPNNVFATEFLYPVSMVLAVLGIGFLIWGIVSDQRQPSTSSSTKPDK
ncbi:MAG: hypothetical protein KDA91_19170 [Planctomycetaceae bacterium]|nr:hypothetical protein [Planctomycetaceae bacterium]